MQLEINDREFHSVLAGLRALQAFKDQLRPVTINDVMELASDAGSVMPLTNDEIDELCERINTEESATNLTQPTSSPSGAE